LRGCDVGEGEGEGFGEYEVGGGEGLRGRAGGVACDVGVERGGAVAGVARGAGGGGAYFPFRGVGDGEGGVGGVDFRGGDAKGFRGVGGGGVGACEGVGDGSGVIGDDNDVGVFIGGEEALDGELGGIELVGDAAHGACFEVDFCADVVRDVLSEDEGADVLSGHDPFDGVSGEGEWGWGEGVGVGDIGGDLAEVVALDEFLEVFRGFTFVIYFVEAHGGADLLLLEHDFSGFDFGGVAVEGGAAVVDRSQGQGGDQGDGYDGDDEREH